MEPLFFALFAVAFTAGIIKGIVGFGMPMVILSGLSFFVAPQVALAGLILPTLLTNGWQALHQGRQAAVQTIERFKLFLLLGGIAMAASSQLVTDLPEQIFLGVLGLIIIGFTALLAVGWQLPAAACGPRAEAGLATVIGAIGGISGVWAPLTVTYLTAIGTSKQDQIRIQGVIYGLGAVVLFFAHILSGVLNVQTLSLSASLVPPALLGMWVGRKINGRVSAHGFRRATLLVLVIAGINLLRRAFWG